MRTIDWADGRIIAIDQTRLPDTLTTLRIDTVDELIDAIKRLAIRGAPALGVAGALGVALLAQRGAGGRGHVGGAVGDDRRGDERGDVAGDGRADVAGDGRGDVAGDGRGDVGGDRRSDVGDDRRGDVGGDVSGDLRADAARLRAARPTAVNLAWGVDRVLAVAGDGPEAALAEALLVLTEDIRRNRELAFRGAQWLAERIGNPVNVQTHCNAGSLACVEWGTALGIVRALWETDGLGHVYVDETRPLLQGARLTAWELAQQGIPHTVVVDSAGASVIARGLADAVVVGADRIAANGDVVNKIGTYPLALAAARAGIPFVVAAPESTIDLATADGAQVEIEIRDPAEIVGEGPYPQGKANALNFAFDVTPADLVTAIITEERIIHGKPLG